VSELLQQHVAGVYRFALRLTGNAHTAEDLTQEALLRAWRHRRRLREPAALRVWLLRIAVNLWRDDLRRRRPEAAEQGPEQVGCNPGRSVEQRVVEQEDVQRTLDAIDALPARQREVLHLVALEGLSIGEAAEVLGISNEAVKATLSLARKKLRERLKDVLDEHCAQRRVKR
jgi:RNA polymerase sigma-70 factor (ECF subfamily)